MQAAEFGDVGAADPFGRVRADRAGEGAQVGAFEVGAEEVAAEVFIAHGGGDEGQIASVNLKRRGDEGGAVGDGAAGDEFAGDGVDVGEGEVGVAEVFAEEAVDLEVDEGIDV